MDDNITFFRLQGHQKYEQQDVHLVYQMPWSERLMGMYPQYRDASGWLLPKPSKW
jgi:hypothetical protein